MPPARDLWRLTVLGLLLVELVFGVALVVRSVLVDYARSQTARVVHFQP